LFGISLFALILFGGGGEREREGERGRERGFSFGDYLFLEKVWY